MSYQLDPASEPGAELVRTICHRLADGITLTGNRRRSMQDRIHAARVSSKKVRAAFKLLRSREEKRYRRENRILRDAARDLSALRDADAILGSFDAVMLHYAISRQTFAPVRAALLAHRRAVTPSRAAIERRLRRFVAQLGEVQQRLEGWAPHADFVAVARDFSRTYDRARRSFQASKTERSAEAFHEWRKATKAYFYQCRLLRAAWPSAMKELGAELKELGSRLGDEHDLCILRAHLRRVIRKDERAVYGEKAKAALRLITSRRDELRAEARLLGERLFTDKRRAVEARMNCWWAAARPQSSGT